MAEYGYQQQSDFFVASKSLVLKEPTLVDFGSALGKITNVENCVTEEPKSKPAVNETTCYAPTKTLLSTEPRPPKHSGG